MNAAAASMNYAAQSGIAGCLNGTTSYTRKRNATPNRTILASYWLYRLNLVYNSPNDPDLSVTGANYTPGMNPGDAAFGDPVWVDAHRVLDWFCANHY
jgi:hypothetical protein